MGSPASKHVGGVLALAVGLLVLGTIGTGITLAGIGVYKIAVMFIHDQPAGLIWLGLGFVALGVASGYGVMRLVGKKGGDDAKQE